MFDDIKFDDGEKSLEILERLYDLSEKEDYVAITEQIKKDSHFDWGKGLNALIISDRCPGRANGLTDYLFEKTDLSNIMLLRTFVDAQEYINGVIPDILIFVGYQEDKQNYRVQDIVLKQNPNAFIMMYAFLDNHIKTHCAENGILYAFSSTKPVADCVSCIKELYTAHTEQLNHRPENKKGEKSRVISIFSKMKNRQED